MLPSAFARKYDANAINIALELFLRRPDWIHRIVETASITENRLHRAVSLTMTVPEVVQSAERPSRRNPLRATALVLPIMRVQRGHMLDNLDITDSGGSSLPVLSQDEDKALARMMLESLFNQATADERLDPEELWDARNELGRIPYLSQVAAFRRYESLLSDHARPTRLTELLRAQEGLVALAYFLCFNFLTSIEIKACPLDELVIKYAYDVRYTERFRQNDHPTEHVYERVRQLVGQRPYSFLVETKLAFDVPSYHFRMASPEGHYCNRQYFLGPPSVEYSTGGETPRRQPWVEPAGVHYSGSEERGMPYAHLFVHGLNKHARFALDARTIFYESPPGSIGTAFIAALIASSFLVITAFDHNSFAQHADPVALLLALGGAGTLWLRPNFVQTALLQAPLAARLGLLGTGLTTLGAALELLVVGAAAPLSPGALTLSAIVIATLTGIQIAILAVLAKRLVRAYRAAALIRRTQITPLIDIA